MSWRWGEELARLFLVGAREANAGDVPSDVLVVSQGLVFIFEKGTSERIKNCIFEEVKQKIFIYPKMSCFHLFSWNNKSVEPNMPLKRFSDGDGQVFLHFDGTWENPKEEIEVWASLRG